MQWLLNINTHGVMNLNEQSIRIQLQQTGIRAPATVNRHISLLHHMFFLAIQWGHIEKNPVQAIHKFQENNQRQRFLTEDEVRRLFKAAEDDHNSMAGCNGTDLRLKPLI